MIMIFLIWKDYDGTYTKKFKHIEAAKIEIAKLQAKIDYEKKTNNSYGTEILIIISGKEMEIKIIEISAKIH